MDPVKEGTMATDEIELQRGLKGVYIDTTESSRVMGDIGRLVYRGYDIHDLATKSTFEETSYLLLYGNLPSSSDLAEFDAQLKSSRSLPPAIFDVISHVKNAHPMDVLRTAVSALSAFDDEVNDNSREATLRKAVSLTARCPVIVAAHHRIRSGLEVIAPDPSLGQAANFLYMLSGEIPDADSARLMDIDFILHADHGSNASAFAARVTASTLADLYCAVVTGIGTLKGPLHGGAAEAVMDMALEIGDEDQAEGYVRNVLDNGGRVMGFGHRVYTALDPRAIHLKEGTLELGQKQGQPKWFRILSKVEEVMQPYTAKGICTNVDFWSGSIYYLLGIPEDLFVSIFAMGRVPGWSVQVLEQFQDNVLIRPLLVYQGPMDLDYVPIEQRG